jgi:hypothetical protein
MGRYSYHFSSGYKDSIMKYVTLTLITIASIMKLLTIIPLFLADICEIGYQRASVDAYEASKDVFTQWNTLRKELVG